jgi:hypothetical protein
MSYAECRTLNVIMLLVIMLLVILLNVIMLNVIMLSVMAPRNTLHYFDRKIIVKSFLILKLNSQKMQSSVSSVYSNFSCLKDFTREFRVAIYKIY